MCPPCILTLVRRLSLREISADTCGDQLWRTFTPNFNPSPLKSRVSIRPKWKTSRCHRMKGFTKYVHERPVFCPVQFSCSTLLAVTQKVGPWMRAFKATIDNDPRAHNAPAPTARPPKRAAPVSGQTTLRSGLSTHVSPLGLGLRPGVGGELLCNWQGKQGMEV